MIDNINSISIRQNLATISFDIDLLDKNFDKFTIRILFFLGCCTTPVNVIKFKINYSCFFRDVEKTKYVLNVCQFRWRKSNHFVKNHS